MLVKQDIKIIPYKWFIYSKEGTRFACSSA